MIEHGIRLDVTRESRVGLDEAIYSASKSATQLDAIIANAIASGTRNLLTRLDEPKHDSLAPNHRSALDYDPVSRTAILGARRECCEPERIAVVTGGSSDVPVGREVVRTLEYHGERCLYLPDVGVAGLWRLLDQVDRLRQMHVVIVAAGMEGALPSVVGGLVPGVVIALPTSVGYGVARDGQVALHSALASCAPGIVTVNIDNGYGAACAALRSVRQHTGSRQRLAIAGTGAGRARSDPMPQSFGQRRSSPKEEVQ
jgi:NCAIR mutase (PurE)-related protein